MHLFISKFRTFVLNTECLREKLKPLEYELFKWMVKFKQELGETH